MGRPRKSQDARAKRREIYSTDCEWAEVSRRARAASLSISRYLLDRRSAPGPSRVDDLGLRFSLGELHTILEELSREASRPEPNALHQLTLLRRAEKRIIGIMDGMRAR